MEYNDENVKSNWSRRRRKRGLKRIMRKRRILAVPKRKGKCTTIINLIRGIRYVRMSRQISK